MFGTSPTNYSGGEKRNQDPRGQSTPIRGNAYERDLDPLAGEVVKAIKDGKIISDMHKNVKTSRQEMVGILAAERYVCVTLYMHAECRGEDEETCRDGVRCRAEVRQAPC